MNANVQEVIVECTRASDEERMSFPEVVAALMQAGIERYHTDLLRSEKVYYASDGSSQRLACHELSIPAANSFNAAQIEAALRAIQQSRIQYLEFCRRIAQAGCVGYFVSLAGRRAVYYGRTGEIYVEYFPPS